jgi:hypothetical protein
MLKPLTLSNDELQRAIDLISYLKDHPEENQNTGLVKKLKFVIRQWLDIEYVSMSLSADPNNLAGRRTRRKSKSRRTKRPCN